MTQIVRWTRVPGLLALGAAALVAGCETPSAPLSNDADGVSADLLVTSLAKKTGEVPANPPKCEAVWDAARKLCYADANAKHGNASGLPVNLNGVTGGNQSGTNGAVLTVSVLGTLDFDLSKIDLSTIRAGDAAKTGPVLTPLDKKGNGDYQASIVDLNGDGILDLMLHFSLPLMVANQDITASTTKLCVYGEGPGYVMNGCGVGGGSSEEPPDTLAPDYARLPYCPADAPRTSGKLRCAVIQGYGRDLGPFADVKVLEMNPPTGASQGTDPAGEANRVFPGWLTIPEDSLVGTYAGSPVPSIPWKYAMLPFGRDGSGTCGLSGTPDVPWGSRHRLLVRSDFQIPAEATNVRVQFIVDDLARVYFNGTEVTSTWRYSSEPIILPNGFPAFQCATYSSMVTLTVPIDVLTLGGKNKLGLWVDDAEGGSSYLDFRVIADVPVYKP